MYDKHREKSRNKIILLLIGSLIFMGLMGGVVYLNDGIATRSNVQSIERMIVDIRHPQEWSRKSDGSCKKYLNFESPNWQLVCITNSEKPEVLIVGDSHALALNSSVYANKVKLNTVVLAVHGCPPLQGFTVTKHGVEDPTECKNLANWALKILKNIPTIKIVLLESMGPWYFKGTSFDTKENNYVGIIPTKEAQKISSEEMFKSGYSSFISQLIDLNKTVIFVIDVPEMNVDPNKCIAKRPFSFSNQKILNCQQPLKGVLERQKEYRKLIMSMQAENPKLDVFDSNTVFCDTESCFGKINDEVLYFEQTHINVNGSKLLLDNIIKERIKL